MNFDNQNIGIHNLKVCSTGKGPMTKPQSQDKDGMMAYFSIDPDMTLLFPYINSVAKQAELYETPPYIRFFFMDILCVLYSKNCFISPVNDRDHARSFVLKFVTYLNDIKARRDEIIPNHKIFLQASTIQMLKILPQTNCRECGFASCLAFAAMLSKQQTIPGRCPHIGNPLNEKAFYPVRDSNGNLLSTIIFDIDLKENDIALKNANKYIKKLENKISELSSFRENFEKEANESLPSPLSEREIEVIRMVACGVTNVEISQILEISDHTVKSHVVHIFNKLGVNTRTQASVWAAKYNLV